MKRNAVMTFAVFAAICTLALTTGTAAGPPAIIITWTGTPQSTGVNADFGVRLVAVVRDAGGNGVQGSTVTFTAPSSGASATFNGSLTATATSDGNGIAQAPPLRANGVGGSYVLTATTPGVTGSAQFTLTNTGGGGGGGSSVPVAPTNLRLIVSTGPPSTLAVAGGSPQSTAINTSFGVALQARVTDDASNPVTGISVTFTAPASGATARFGSSATATATTNAGGIASAPTLTANGTTGSYTVVATVSGVSGNASFNLSNTTPVAPPPTGGPTWAKASIPVSFRYAMCLVNDPARPSDYYAFVTNGAGTPISVVKSTNFAATWTKINTTNFTGDPWGCSIDPNPARNPNTPPTMYTPAGYGTMGVLKSTDGGVTWQQLFPSRTGPVGTVSRYWPPDVYHVAILPDNPPNHLVVTFHAGGWNGSETGFIESTDGGASWIAHNPPGGIGQSHYLLAPDANNWIVVSQDNNGQSGTWKTSTAGRSGGQVSTSAWRRVDGAEHIHGDFSGAVVNSVVYAPHSGGIKRSTDRGDTWQSIYTSGPIGTIVATASSLYANFSLHRTVIRAPRGNDTSWSTYTSPPTDFKANEIGPGTSTVAASTDGTRWYVVVAINDGGIWRYVE